MASTVEFAFTVEDMVEIQANKRQGTVVGSWIDRDGIKWARVEYVAQQTNVVCNDWFREKHLKAVG